MAYALADPASPSYWSITTRYIKELEKSNNVHVIYLDFAKAFDKVDHGILLSKLKKTELMVKSVSGYTIFYQTDTNVFRQWDKIK